MANNLSIGGRMFWIWITLVSLVLGCLSLSLALWNNRRAYVRGQRDGVTAMQNTTAGLLRSWTEIASGQVEASDQQRTIAHVELPGVHRVNAILQATKVIN